MKSAHHLRHWLSGNIIQEQNPSSSWEISESVSEDSSIVSITPEEPLEIYLDLIIPFILLFLTRSDCFFSDYFFSEILWGVIPVGIDFRGLMFKSDFWVSFASIL